MVDEESRFITGDAWLIVDVESFRRLVLSSVPPKIGPPSIYGDIIEARPGVTSVCGFKKLLNPMIDIFL